MQYYSPVSPNANPYDPQAAMTRMQAPAPPMYGNAAVQQHFSDVYTPASQNAAVNMSRGSTQAAGQYYNRASEAANQSVLAGLGLLSEQESNARQRNQASQKIGMNFMSDMFGNAGKILGGLL